MNGYCQLNREQRYHLERLLQQGKSIAQVALCLGCHRSTIYREVRRNKQQCGKYKALEAWRKTLSRRRRQDFGPRVKILSWVEQAILEGISLGWSPELICGRLKLEHSFKLSHEAIYRYILRDKKYGGTLFKLLRRRGRRRRLRKKSRFLHEWKPRRPITERPIEANERSEVGHWERDTMVAAKHEGGVLVFTDRKTRLTLVERITTTRSSEALEKTLSIFDKSQSLPCKSITNDNGHEFAMHQEVENILGVKVYFARPYAPWQRGSNENAIGLIRQFIPKGCDIKTITDSQLKDVEKVINLRPKKIFGYRTPYEEFWNTNLNLIKIVEAGA